jgi:hypothetical protein
MCMNNGYSRILGKWKRRNIQYLSILAIMSSTGLLSKQEKLLSIYVAPFNVSKKTFVSMNTYQGASSLKKSDSPYSLINKPRMVEI